MTLPTILILAAVSLVAPVYWLLRKKTGIARYALGALMLFSAFFAFANSLLPPDYAVHEFVPFKPFADIASYGYQSIFDSFIRFALPFAPLGLLLPFVFVRRMRSVERVALVSALMTVLSFALRLILPLNRSVNMDELWYAPLGACAGFALYTLLSWIILRKRAFAQKWALPEPQKKNRIAAIAVLTVIYLGAAILMVIDSSIVAPLVIPSSDTPLPASRSAGFTPEKTGVRLQLYKAAEADVSGDHTELLKALDISGNAASSATDARFYAERSGRSIELLDNGEWHYNDIMAEAASQGPFAPEEAESVNYANAFLDKTGLCPDRALMDTSRMRAFDEDGEETGTSEYVVYFSSMLDGYKLRTTGEIAVIVGYHGAIVSADKHGPQFTKAQSVTTMPLSKALDTALAGDVAHTLYDEADSVIFTGGELVYWYDENEGNLLPVWVLQGTAYGQNGETGFEAFIPAM